MKVITLCTCLILLLYSNSYSVSTPPPSLSSTTSISILAAGAAITSGIVANIINDSNSDEENEKRLKELLFNIGYFDQCDTLKSKEIKQKVLQQFGINLNNTNWFFRSRYTDHYLKGKEDAKYKGCHDLLNKFDNLPEYLQDYIEPYLSKELE